MDFGDKKITIFLLVVIVLVTYVICQIVNGVW